MQIGYNFIFEVIQLYALVGTKGERVLEVPGSVGRYQRVPWVPGGLEV